MQELAKTISKNGFTYLLHTRGEKAFIYEQTGEDENGNVRTFAFEVFRRIVDAEKEVFNKVYPIRERFPANEDFGRWAWTIKEEADAIERFKKIENAED